MKIGLCLSGGGIRSAAHIGVIKALEEHGIKICAVSGTSGGSIVAAMYAAGYPVQQIGEIFKDCAKILWNDKSKLCYLAGGIINWFRDPFGLISAMRFERMLCKIFAKVGASGMTTAALSLAIPAVDINSSQIVLFVSDKKALGDNDNNCVYYSDTRICKAVRASCSLPIIFRPIKIHGHTLVDGGLRLNVPVFPLRSFSVQRVLAVDLSCSSCDTGCADDPLKLAFQTVNIITSQLSALQSEKADYRLRVDLCDVGLLELDRVEECIHAGYKAAKTHISEIITALYLEQPTKY